MPHLESNLQTLVDALGLDTDEIHADLCAILAQARGMPDYGLRIGPRRVEGATDGVLALMANAYLLGYSKGDNA